jgi:hypothetical protein
MYIGNGQVGKLTSMQVQNSAVLFFNEMYPESMFRNAFLIFNDTCRMVKFTYSNFVDTYLNLYSQGMGGTNFQSVFKFFVDFRKENPKVDEQLIPNFIICFSDG